MIEDLPARTVDAVIRERCDARRDGLVGRRRRRVDGAERALRACFERYGEPALTDEERDLLALERAFGEPDPIARVAPADALLLVVPRFLLEPEWHGDDRIDRRLRYLLGWRLAHRLAHYPEFLGLDLTEAMAAVDDAELLARRAMRRERAEEARRELMRDGRADLLAALDLLPARPPIDAGIRADRPTIRRPFPVRSP